MLSATTDTMIVALRLKSDIFVLPSPLAPLFWLRMPVKGAEPGSTAFHRDQRRVVHHAYPPGSNRTGVCDN
jgi:hypothetical protein